VKNTISTPSFLVHDAHPQGLPVVATCPVNADAVPESGAFQTTVSFETGVDVPAQAVALTPCTPQGIRWVELSLLATRKGHAALGELDTAEDSERPVVQVAADGGRALDNGLVRVRVNASSEMSPVTFEGCKEEAHGAWTQLGSLAPEIVAQKGQVHREPVDGMREISVLRNGPLRGQVEIKGQLASLTGTPSLQYRLTVELWKGLPGVRVDWMLSNLVPDQEALEVHRATLGGRWRVGEDTTRRFVQTNYGPYYVRREVRNPSPVALAADAACGPVHVVDPAMLLDDAEYAPYFPTPEVATAEWLALEGERATIFATLVDFMASRPNQLESHGDHLAYHLIPPGHTTRWPQGRRREQTLLLAIAEPGADAGEPLRVMNALNTQGRAQATPEILAALQCHDIHTVLRHVPGSNIRLTMLLDALCRLDTPGAKWDLGDTADAGYTRSYAPIPNRFERLPGAPELPVQFDPTGQCLYPWSAGEFVAPVWTNNEYDVTHTIATEVMRTGKPDHINMLRWTARHTIEVDFVAYSDDRWHHRATPAHSEHHTTTGAYPSHFWTQGLLQYYMLGGDRDALEIALALGDKTLENARAAEIRPWKFDRELGWSLLSLVCLVEAGFEPYRAECDRIADFLQGYDRAAFTGAVNLSSGRAGRSLERQMIDNGFGYSSMVEAMDRYQKVSGREDTAAWLDALLGQLHDECWNAIREGEVPSVFCMVPHVMAIGYERTGDTEFLRTGVVMLHHFLDTLALQRFPMWGYTKQSAMVYRGLCRFLGHADREDLLGPFEIPGISSRRGA